MLTEFPFILMWSFVSLMAAIGWINKVAAEGGPLFFIQNWMIGLGLSNTMIFTVLFGCEICLSGQIYLWTSLLYWDKGIFLSSIGALSCVGTSFLAMKFLNQE